MKDIINLTKLKVMLSTHSCTVNVCEKIFTVGESQLIVLMQMRGTANCRRPSARHTVLRDYNFLKCDEVKVRL